MLARIEPENCRWVLGEHGGGVKQPWTKLQVNRKDGIFPPVPPSLPTLNPPDVASPPPSSHGARISPAVIFIIVILAALFFVSGLLHLLVRFLVKHPSSDASPSNGGGYPEISSQDALQRQLQQLFHLHDAGLDQAFIDALPVFLYKEVVGLKEPFDCAVCLSEFSENDKLRLLPMCSHAFHIQCIDTWLLSNSSCPLCRGTLFSPGFSIENPVYDYDDLPNDVVQAGNVEYGPHHTLKGAVGIEKFVSDKGALPVKLGKFKRLDDEQVEIGETSSSNLCARRCFSMGSYQYVVGDSDLRVTFKETRERNLPDGAEQRAAATPDQDEPEGTRVNTVSKGESFSMSKIWLWPKKDKYPSSAASPLRSDPPWTKDLQD